ncbi:MAG: AraC family transcriptional regulator [Candidatus Eisenbacteria bacterium]
MKRKQRAKKSTPKAAVTRAKLPANAPPIVAKAVKHIERNLTGIGTTTDVSRAVGVSREHLSRVFSQVMGVKLWAFVNRAKVEKAKVLLRDKSTLVKQLHRELGFGCQSTFYNAFRRYVGKTPTEFRVRGGKKARRR